MCTLIVAICVLGLLGAAFAAHQYLDSTYAQPSRDLSKMMSVRFIVSEGLSAHYKSQGSYPGSLRELSLQTLRWGDEGSSVRDLDTWHYRSDGQSFSMSWEGARGMKLFLEGRGGQSYYVEESKR